MNIYSRRAENQLDMDKVITACNNFNKNFANFSIPEGLFLLQNYLFLISFEEYALKMTVLEGILDIFDNYSSKPDQSPILSTFFLENFIPFIR